MITRYTDSLYLPWHRTADEGGNVQVRIVTHCGTVSYVEVMTEDGWTVDNDLRAVASDWLAAADREPDDEYL